MKYKKYIKALDKDKPKKALKKIDKDITKQNLYDRKERILIYLENKRLIKKNKKKAHNRSLNEAPKLTILEEIGNAVSHGIGALLAILGMILLLLKSDTPLKLTGAIFYSVSMIFMMTMSCLYHSWKWGIRVKRIFRRFDYSSIYLLIGGTFSPILLCEFINYYPIFAVIWFILMWLIIITGITMVCIFGPGRLRWLHFTLYFVIGWAGLLFVPVWIKHNLAFLWFILVGGLIYTIGMIPFAMRGKKAAHFIWHIFVILGAACHFVGIYTILYLNMF